MVHETNLTEICAVEGITGSRRFAPTHGTGPFLAIYELDCDDLDAVVGRLRELGASGTMSSLQWLDTSNAPRRADHRRGADGHQTDRDVYATPMAFPV